MISALLKYTFTWTFLIKNCFLKKRELSLLFLTSKSTAWIGDHVKVFDVGAVNIAQTSPSLILHQRNHWGIVRCCQEGENPLEKYM